MATAPALLGLLAVLMGCDTSLRCEVGTASDGISCVAEGTAGGEDTDSGDDSETEATAATAPP